MVRVPEPTQTATKQGKAQLIIGILGILGKDTSFQSWRSQEKVCQPAPAPLEAVSPGSILGEVESFTKLDGW